MQNSNLETYLIKLDEKEQSEIPSDSNNPQCHTTSH